MIKTLLSFVFTTSLCAQPNFVLIGPPGSGKGTFSSFMTKEKKYHQICLGDIVRLHKKNNTDTGKAIAAKGGFVDDELAYAIIRDEVSLCVENKLPFIIDGFPRNIPAFDFLISLFAQKNVTQSMVFIYFKIDDQTCIERINNRLVCFNCSGVFNTTTKKPQTSMVCDSCNNPLELREGDTSAATLKRLAYYREHTEPLIEKIKEDFKVISIDAKAPAQECIAKYSQL